VMGWGVGVSAQPKDPEDFCATMLPKGILTRMFCLCFFITQLPDYQLPICEFLQLITNY